MRQALQTAEMRMPWVVALARRLRGRLLRRHVRMHVEGSGNRIRWGDSILSGVRFDIAGDENVVHIADGCALRGVVFHIRGDRHSIALGKGCRFNNGGSVWFEDSRCSLVVGDGSSFEHVNIAVTEPESKVEIGRDCMFAYDIDVRTRDSHSIVDVETGLRVNAAMNVRIGDHVWVGAHAMLLKGVELRDDCIVASGSVVTKSFDEAGVIVAGNPARIVRRGVSWLRERI